MGGFQVARKFLLTEGKIDEKRKASLEAKYTVTPFYDPAVWSAFRRSKRSLLLNFPLKEWG